MQSSDASDRDSDVLCVGRVIAGKFQVLRVIAQGAMGVVLAATHLQLDRTVALKFLRVRGGSNWDNWDALDRFTREAKAAAQLESEHVVHVIDLGISDDDMPYIVMEYLEGQSLLQVLQTRGPLELASAAEFAIQTCEGLAEAHSRGIVHRDIKPDNLFVVERCPGFPSIKILDFGISKLSVFDERGLAAGVFMGTPCYMSPEQLRSTATVDHRTDIWSLGASLYELVTGKLVFDDSGTLTDLISAILHDTAPRADVTRPDLPKEFADVIERCLSKDRELRFASAAELAQALVKFAPDRAHIVADRASMRPPAPISEHPGDAYADATDSPLENSAIQVSPSRRELPTLTDPKLAEAIVPALATLPASEPSPTVPSALAALEPAVAAPPAPREPALSVPPTLAPTAAVPASLEPAALSAPPPPREKKPRRRPWVRQVTIAVLAVETLVVVSLAATLHKRPTFTAVAVSAAPRLGRSAIAPAPLKMVDLLVRATPRGATITIDGVRVSSNPFHALQPKDDVFHNIEASLPGFETKRQSIGLVEDTIVDLQLDPIQQVTQDAARPAPAALHTSGLPALAHNPTPTHRTQPTAQANANAPSPSPNVRAGGAVSDGTGVMNTQVNPSGGREPVRPIETKNPFGTP